jgi:hypothetical protein
MSTIKQKFPVTLNTGKCFISSIFINDNAKTAPVTVQFAQKIVGENNNPILTKTLGGNSFQVVTDLIPFTMERAIAYGLVNSSGTPRVLTDDNPFFAEDIFEAECNIAVIENTIKNENKPKQQPKVNPVTGEIITYQGQPVYRHTQFQVVPSTQVVRQFLREEVSSIIKNPIAVIKSTN